MALLFENQTADDTSLIQKSTGGNMQIQVQGNLDGASIQPQISQDELDFIDFGDPITTEVAFKIELKNETRVQFVMTGSGASTDINLSALV